MTIEVERAPARMVEISRRFVVDSNADSESVTEARIAELEHGAVHAVHGMLDELEPTIEVG